MAQSFLKKFELFLAGCKDYDLGDVKIRRVENNIEFEKF